MVRSLGLAAMGTLALAGCATGPSRYPVEAVRYHYDAVAQRGTIALEPPPGTPVDSLEFAAVAEPVRAALARVGFTPAAPGTKADNLATVIFTRTARPLPPRRSGVTLGLGGGGYSGGYSGGVGVGGGVSIPLGGRRVREGVMTELVVRIRRGPDAVWEGTARTIGDLTGPGTDTPAVAARLADAMVTGFPGESGRTIEVR